MPARNEFCRNDTQTLFGKMSASRLRGRQIYVERAEVYKSSHWDAASEGWIDDEVLTAHGVILARRSRQAKELDPYAYITGEFDSARGIWLNEAGYRLIEPEESTPN